MDTKPYSQCIIPQLSTAFNALADIDNTINDLNTSITNNTFMIDYFARYGVNAVQMVLGLGYSQSELQERYITYLNATRARLLKTVQGLSLQIPTEDFSKITIDLKN